MAQLWEMGSESGWASLWDGWSVSLKALDWADVTARWMGYGTGLPSAKRWGLRKETGLATLKACGLDWSTGLRLGQCLATSLGILLEKPSVGKLAPLKVPVWETLLGVWSAHDLEQRLVSVCGDYSPPGRSQA